MKKTRLFLLVAGILSAAIASIAQAIDQKPQALSTPLPILGVNASDVSGEVVLQVDINAHGYVTKVTAKSSTNPDLVEPCIEAVKQWTYSPAMKDGKAVPLTFIQPLRFGDHTLSTEALVSSKPKVLGRESPELPDALKNVTGKVVVLVKLGADGKITSASIYKSTHEELNAITLAAVEQWRFAPALKAGINVESTVYVPFDYVGNKLEEDVIEKAVLVDNLELVALRQSSPRIPESLKNVDGQASIAITVNPQGLVTSASVKAASDKELGEIARQTTLTWKFKPIIKNGVAVSAKAIQPFVFGNGIVSVEKIDKLPKIKKAVEPELPESLKGVSGFVKVQFAVNAQGQVTAVVAKESSLRELEEPVLTAAKQWVFSPAIKDGVPSESRILVPITFNM